MTTFPNSPRLIKGAIVGIDIFNPVSSVILFQYNPETLTRTLKAKTAGEGANSSEALRLQGAPEESITLNIEINAASMGIYPQLSALEMLIYPKSSVVIANTALLAAGT